MPQAFATFGVHGRLPDDVHEVLTLAEEYREKLCALYQERHERTIDLRNERFPALWNALVEYESSKARCNEIEKTIKAHHAKVRDRNAVKYDQRGELEQARAARDAALERVKACRAQWAATLTAWRKWFKSAADWKNVKSLAKRRLAYEALSYPTEDGLAAMELSFVEPSAVEALGRLDLECDLRERELSAEYQAKGLASGIRGEIDEASQPKLSKTGTGTRYVYGRKPDIRPWKKLTLQFVGGLSFEAALEGTRAFKLTDLGRRYYLVHQQIGTADHPRLISYRAKIDKPFPANIRFQLWSLKVEGELFVGRNKAGIVREITRHKAYVIPTIADNIAKPTGSGLLQCRLSWRRVPGGVQVAEFHGPHVDERLVLPDWLVEARMEAKHTLAGCDSEANEWLASVGASPKTGQKQGVVALRQYCFTHPDDAQAKSFLEMMVLEDHDARRQSQRAIRCIEKIYETVTRRVCSLHGELSLAKCDLARKRKYDKRNLLAQDAMPEPVRELLFAVAPGKLKALLEGYGLVASDEVVADLPGDARDDEKTDVFSSWVKSIGRRMAQGEEKSNGSRKQDRKALASGDL